MRWMKECLSRPVPEEAGGRHAHQCRNLARFSRRRGSVKNFRVALSHHAQHVWMAEMNAELARRLAQPVAAPSQHLPH
jgi:hypothetical protein